MRLQAIRLRVRKICEASAAIYPAAGWEGFIPGRLGRVDESLPVAYELEGELLAPVVVGQPLLIRRTFRNGIAKEGRFTSSPIQEIGPRWVRTENSIYLVSALPDATDPNESPMKPDEAFFTDAPDGQREAQQAALEVLRRFLIWVAEGTTLEERGLRASVALYCIRPDLINDATLERIGDLAGCSKQAVHQLADNFRLTTGLAPCT